MSRAYRISVSESLRKVVKGSDHVSTELETLEVLPGEQMAGLLAGELESRGFKNRDGRLVKTIGETTIEIDPSSGKVKVCAEVEEELELTQEQTGWGDQDFGTQGRRTVEQNLRKQAKASLNRQAENEETRLTQQATNQLEDVLRDLQSELDSVVNKVTAEALKTKAAQLGEIKEITEDDENGSMTIVLEV